MNNQKTQQSWNLNTVMRDFGQAWRLFRDPQVPGLLKLLLPVAAVVYFISPIDLMFGPIDDIAILVVALHFFVQLAEQMQAKSGGSGASTPRGDQQTGNTESGPTIETSWHVVDE